MYKIISTWFLLVIAIISTTGEGRADQTYRVQSGDNLYRIGVRFGIPYQKIISANRLKSTTIYPNQALVIPTSKPKPKPQIAQGNRVKPPPAPATNSYPKAIPYSVGSNSDRYRAATVPKDQIKPFVIAKKLPTAPPLSNEEDPLGLGYNPSPTVRKSVALKPQPIARGVTPHRIPTPITPREPLIAKAPKLKTFPRSREVPAAAHYPGRTGNDALDPKHFPQPSFKNPCKPCPSKPAHSRMKTYRVKRGDSVGSVSRKFGVGRIKLRMTNNIPFTRLRPGMVLRIPSS